MIKNNFIKKLGAGFMAGLCAFSMFGNIPNMAVTNAASTSQTESFPSADKVIAQAATLLGSPYGWGFKGYSGVYYQDSYEPLALDFVREQGVDCSGLVYYTMTHLGYKTSGFSWNNPVPVDTMHWLTVDSNCTVTYNGMTTSVDVEKKGISTENKPYWECSDGSTITPGSVVVGENPGGIDHAWIYMGEFNSRAEVVTYLRNIGVDEKLITSATVGDGKGDGGTHWRIESNGSQGCVINNNTEGKRATAMNMYAFRITTRDVEYKITKVLSDNNAVKISGTSPIDGSKAVYGVYSDKNCTKKVGQITVGTDGTGSIKLPNMEYYIKEISAPKGYDISSKIYTLKANSNVNVEEDISSGIIKVNKTAEDKVVSGCEFKLTWTENGTQHSKTAKTNSSGTAEFKNIHIYDMKAKKAIEYNVSEINVADRYSTPKAQNVTLTSGNVDLTVNVTFKNDLKKGSIKINKQSEDNKNGDREFTVTGGGKTYTIKTGADGVAILSNIPVYDSNNKKITYTISEKNVPIKYVIPANQKVALNADSTVNVKFENKLKKFTAEVVKKDSENGSAQGDATLAGAVYGIYRDGTLIDKYTTDEKGYFKTKQYVCGNYTIQEISPSKGYQLDKTVYKVGAEPKNYTTETNPVSINVTEDVIKGKISIIKHSDDTDEIINFEKGAEFEIFLKSAGSYEKAKKSERDYLITNEKGFAQTKELPYGTYTVHQTKTVDDAEFVSDFDVTIAKNGKVYEYVLNNKPFKSYIEVTKIDAETGKMIPYEGAGFQIYDSKEQLVSMSGIDTFYTDNNGCLITPEMLKYGDYSLVEVQAPIGYVLDSTPVEFSVSAESSEEKIVKVTKADVSQKGKISITKTGDSFVSVMTEEGKYTLVFEKTGLSGAIYQITAAEDIITPDGTVRANAGDFIAEIITDENGYAETDLLYLGKYDIEEIEAPFGYVLNDEIQTVELVYAGQEVAVRDTVNTSFVNDHQGVKISLSKVMENDEKFEIYGEDYAVNVRFGLFASEEITAADGSTIPENGLIAEVTLGEDMSAVIAEKLPFSRYYVQEIATDEKYILNGEKYLVNFEYMGQEMTTVDIDCGTFTNDLKRGKVEGKKVDEHDEPLANAVFGLFRSTETAFDSETAIITDISDENGYFEFAEIPCGEYVVCEIAAPDGYIFSDEHYPVIITEDGDVVEITAENQPITVEVSKVDIYGDELEGAEMELVDENGDTVEKWISDGTNHVITKLSAGSYVLKEIAAPDGYVIATDISFEIDIYGIVTVEGVETAATTEYGTPLIVMVDDTTLVKISKQDITTGNELEGAKLQVIDKDGNVVDEWVSGNTPHFIEGVLIAGETYILHEEIAPEGYLIANDIEFTVNEDGTVTEVVMKDEHAPTPDTPTGDTTSRLPGILMITASALIFTVMLIRRRKDDRA